MIVKQVSYRSLITKMTKRGIYANKKEILEEQGIESKGRKITDDAADYPQLVHRGRWRKCLQAYVV